MGEWIEGRDYRLEYNPRPYAYMALGAVVLGRAIAAAALPFIVLGVLVVALGLQMWLRWPNVVMAHDGGLVFRSRTSERRVPWSDIVAVRVSHGRYGGAIRWKIVPGPNITTGARFSDLHQLLVTVERCAPQAQLQP